MFDRHMLSPIQNWANGNYQKFIPNGFGRQYGILERFVTPTEIWDIKNKIIELYGLQSKKQEPLFKDYLGYITEGGAIHKHKDPNQGSLIHTRFNVLVSKPMEGGEPIQEGEVIKVAEGEVWQCNAGLVEHWCTPVIGSKPRIVLSFGFLL